MKRKMTLSMVLTLSMLVSMLAFTTTAQGQQPGRRLVADTGVLTPGPGQTLLITAAPGFRIDDASVVIAWKQYAPAGCSGTPAVCRHSVVSQGLTAVRTLGPNDALSFQYGGGGGSGKIQVFANRDVQSDGSVAAFFDIPAELV